MGWTWIVPCGSAGREYPFRELQLVSIYIGIQCLHYLHNPNITPHNEIHYILNVSHLSVC